MHRVLIESLAHHPSGQRELPQEAAHYLARVRRARIGDAVTVFDRAGWHCRGVVARIDAAGTVTLQLDAAQQLAPQPPLVIALLPLIKGERFDWALEKLTEVGVDEVIIWHAARAVVKLDDARAATRLVRWQTICDEGARQAGRAAPPLVRGPMELPGALAALPADEAAGLRLYGSPEATTGLAPLLSAPRPPRSVCIATGPEGGLAPSECAALSAAGFTPVSFGPRILRAETAPLVAVAMVRQQTAT